jgi:hypothetical protein
LWELDDRNLDHRSVKERISGHCGTPENVVITRTADNDLAIIPLTKNAVLEAVRTHLSANRRVHGDRMDNGDLVYIVTDCNVEGSILYVKLKLLQGKEGSERMLIISAHPPRRWC